MSVVSSLSKGSGNRAKVHQDNSEYVIGIYDLRLNFLDSAS
jgi:hypothetical protein